MLAYLQIKNYALIEHLELNPSPGLTVLTGETGAGKSIMLGAIGLLMGDRADVKSLYDPEQKCIVEGIFQLKNGPLEKVFEEEDLDFSSSTIIRREISPGGKSRAFINDTPVTLDTLRRLMPDLVDIHSQHDSITLGNNAFQLQVVDSFAGSEALLRKYKAAFVEYRSAEKEYRKLVNESAQMKQDADYQQFLFQELSEADPAPNELTELEEEQSLLENATVIREKLYMAFLSLEQDEHSALSLIKNASTQLHQVEKLTEKFASLSERIGGCLIELQDIAHEIEAAGEGIDANGARLEQVHQRLDILNRLMQKHKAESIVHLLKIKDTLSEALSRVNHIDEALELAQEKMNKAQLQMTEEANKLTRSRSAVLESLSKEVRTLLVELGIPNVTIEITLSETQPGETGADLVRLLFSGNKGVAPRELKEVASGGEFSRLMLAIKYILAAKRDLPTMIFDEIDAGISGEAANKVAEMLATMGKKHQIVAITHLHQIAARGREHYFVFKDHSRAKSTSQVKKLNNSERIEEIAQIIGGKNPSKIVIENARELLGHLQP